MYRKYFPILEKNYNNKKLVYLDAACSYLKNEFTIKWISRYYTDYSCCSWDRWSSYLWSMLHSEITESRKNMIKFLWWWVDDIIVYTSGTTDSINRVISWINDAFISTIISSDLEHNSNFLPQFNHCENTKTQFISLAFSEILDTKKLDKKLSKIQGWFLLCITHSSNILWWNLDIKNIAEIVHKYNWYILVDDAQYISYNKENVVDNNVDFLTFSGHKIWWPMWIGILYINNKCKHLIVKSSHIWWWTIKNIKNGTPEYKWLPDFLEWWVQNYSWIIWLNACIGFINKIGYEVINKHVLELTEYCRKLLEESGHWNYLKIISIEWSWLITFKVDWFNVINFSNYCNFFDEKYIVSFRTWSLCADTYVNNYLWWDVNILRISFWIYNDTKDVDIFLEVLTNYLKHLE